MKNNRTFLEKLLDGAKVEWKPLIKVASLTRGRVISKEYLADNLGDYPVYSSQTVNNGEIGKINSFDFDGEFVSWTTDGANAGTVFYRSGKFSITNVCGLIKIQNNLELNYKFLFYWLSIEAKNHVYSGMGNPKLMSHQMEKILIPIPPLSVQTEIVKILDALTALTSELTSELILRRKQYEYYREKLLSHDSSEYSTQKSDKVKFFHTSNIQWLHLNEIYKFQYGIGNKIPTIGGKYPVYGSNGIVGSHNEYNSEDAPVIGHIGAYAGIVNWAEGKHFVTYNGIICNKINDNVNSRYAYYLLLSQNFIDKANKASQPFISYDILNKCIVPVPPLKEQQRIVSILDKFETLTNSITEGLPLAIEQSQKRYEYYRELLLNFS